MVRILYRVLLVLGCFCAIQLYSIDTNDKLGEVFSKGVTVDLREPIFKDGILSTDKGGVVTSDNIRIQARKIQYIKKVQDDEYIFKIIAEDDVMLEYSGTIFIGKRVEYDFHTEQGTVYGGRASFEPWYIGGDTIEFLPDGSFLIKEAFISSCENADSEWQFKARNIRIKNTNLLFAKNVQLRFLRLPMFWFPSLHVNFRDLLDFPVDYKARWGGNQGARISMRYRFLSRELWRGFARLDYSFKEGFGGGIDFTHTDADKNADLILRNYATYNSEENRQRYRFDGIYSKNFNDDNTSVNIQYDKLSDADMVSHYHDQNFNLKSAGNTLISLRHQEKSWIAQIFSRLRINSFQTIKQELPTVSLSLKPFEVGNSGIIADSSFKASYLDFEYAKDTPKSYVNFNSIRVSANGDIYKPFRLGSYLTLTPGVGVRGIYYGNSYDFSDKWLGIAVANCELKTLLSRIYDDHMHTIEPYIAYKYFGRPTTPISDHYIFDIHDGLSSLNLMCFGIKNSIYKKSNDEISRLITIDIYGNAFFDNATLSKTIPKLYSDIEWLPCNNIACHSNIIWNLSKNRLDKFAVRADYTRNEDFAIGIEYRHRGRFDWRKADRTDFLLDNFYKESVLQASQLSDKHDIILPRLCYRFTPNWTLVGEARHAWNRDSEPNFNEYKLELTTLMRCHWEIKFSYQHKKYDKRFALRVALETSKPKKNHNTSPEFLSWN